MKRTLYFMVLLIINTLTTSAYAKARNAQQHPSVMAALSCIDKIAPIVKNRQLQGPDVTCTIPVSLSETDLDELFKAALRSASMSDKVRGVAEKYSTALAKTVTNFRAADCAIKLQIKRSTIIKALSSEEVKLQLPDQPAECDVTTKKHKIKKLKFAFSPQVEMVKGCVSKFALNMGKIDADCSVCVFNRLYLSTRLVALWANHMSQNAKRVLNAQLGGKCG